MAKGACVCGHTAHWHSHDGTGDCEHDAKCTCSAYRTRAFGYANVTLMTPAEIVEKYGDPVQQPLFPGGCTCLSYGHGLTMTRVNSPSCAAHNGTHDDEWLLNDEEFGIQRDLEAEEEDEREHDPMCDGERPCSCEEES